MRYRAGNRRRSDSTALSMAAMLTTLLLPAICFAYQTPAATDVRDNPTGVPSFGMQVYVFELRDCPLANAYAPEIRRLVGKYGKKGIRFSIVYEDPDADPKASKAHLREYGLPCDLILDPKHTFARYAGATISPEAAIYRNGALVYRGRIDDLYPSTTTRRQRATSHELAAALDQVLAGKSVKIARTQAIGCILPG